MKKTAITIIFLLLIHLAAVVLSGASAGLGDRILHTSSGTTLGLGQIIQDLARAQLIFVGEQHSSVSHHDLQLRIIRTLHNLRIPLAVGLEMFTARDQEHLDAWVQGTLPEKEFIEIHKRNWGDTWELYRSIYIYARDKQIPLVGLNVPEEISTRVARHGFSSLSDEQRAQLPLVSCDIDDDYRSFIRMALAVHGVSENIRGFDNFCEAQLIWDTAMAFRLVRHLEQDPARTVVVLAGNSHSWRAGIPEQLNRFGQDIVHRIILPEIPPVQTRHSIDRNLTDYLWLVE